MRRYNKPSFAPPKLALGYTGVVLDLLAPMARDLVSSPLWLLTAIAAGDGARAAPSLVNA